MLSDVLLYAILLAAAFCLYWAAPGDRPNIRVNVLLYVSAAFILLVSPGGFLSVLCLFLVVFSSNKAFAHRKSLYLLSLSLLLCVLPLILSRTLGDLTLVFTLGVAFATVRSIGLVLDAYAGRGTTQNSRVALYLFFFPLYAVGPVEKFETFEAKTFTSPFVFEDFYVGIARVVYGVFLAHFICDSLIRSIIDNWLPGGESAFASFDVMSAWSFVFLKFLYTYLNFVAFTEIAIGTCRLFGMHIVENFNWPLISRNIADFWRRYHISMGNWITRYLFFPVVGALRAKWAMYFASVFSFVMFGLWHAFTPNYLFWGGMHGAAIAIYHFYRNTGLDARIRQVPLISLSFGLIGGVMTICYVAWLQTFANLSSFSAGLELTSRMIGW